MPIFCCRCGRNIDDLWQDNMSYILEPLCEDCVDEIEQENQRFLNDYIIEYELYKYDSNERY